MPGTYVHGTSTISLYDVKRKTRGCDYGCEKLRGKEWKEGRGMGDKKFELKGAHCKSISELVSSFFGRSAVINRKKQHKQ